MLHRARVRGAPPLDPGALARRAGWTLSWTIRRVRVRAGSVPS